MSSGSLPTDWYVNRKLGQIKAAAALQNKNKIAKSSAKNTPATPSNSSDKNVNKEPSRVTFANSCNTSFENSHVEPYLLPQHPQNGHEIV